MLNLQHFEVTPLYGNELWRLIWRSLTVVEDSGVLEVVASAVGGRWTTSVGQTSIVRVLLVLQFDRGGMPFAIRHVIRVGVRFR